MQSETEEILFCCLCNISSTLFPDFVHVNDCCVKRDDKEKPIILVISHLLQSLGGQDSAQSTIILRSQYICNLCIQELNEYDETVDRLKKMEDRFKHMISKSNDEPEISQQFFAYQSDENTESKDDNLNDYLIEVSDIGDNIIEETDELFGDTDAIDVTDLRFETEQQTEWLPPLNEEIVTDVVDENENSEVFKTRCLQCNKVFFNKTRFKDHVEFEHRTDANVLVCCVCHRLFRCLEALLLHKNIHEGRTERQCRYCEKSYTKKENVLRHMQVHWHKSAYNCDICDESFPDKSSLSNHVQKHEMESGHVECEICAQVFKNKRTLKTHMLTHDKDRVRYKCNFCFKSFTDKYRLKLHCQNQHSMFVQ